MLIPDNQPMLHPFPWFSPESNGASSAKIHHPLNHVKGELFSPHRCNIRRSAGLGQCLVKTLTNCHSGEGQNPGGGTGGLDSSLHWNDKKATLIYRGWFRLIHASFLMVDYGSGPTSGISRTKWQGDYFTVTRSFIMRMEIGAFESRYERISCPGHRPRTKFSSAPWSLRIPRPGDGVLFVSAAPHLCSCFPSRGVTV